MVLVGRTGNGKSATGNTILGREAFKSESRFSCVTSTCEMHASLFSDNLILNVIDTPGLFGSGVEAELVGKQIAKCINLAKDGIHGVLVVYSLRTRFSPEEAEVLHSLKALFGHKISEFIVVVFTGGDVLERNQTLEDYLGLNSGKCPEPSKETLSLCKNRYVVFDNKTNDKRKQFEQVQRLVSLVNMVVSDNGGQPYTDDRLLKVQIGAMQLRDQQTDDKDAINNGNSDLLKRVTEKVELRMKEVTVKLEKRVAEEQSARRKADEEIRRLQGYRFISCAIL